MRLGILPLGPVPDTVGIAALADALRAGDVDVVVPEDTPATALAVSREAERLHRADCDGVLIVAADERLARPAALQTALRLPGVPLLLAGTFAPGLFDTVGAWEEVGGVWYDRLLLGESGLPVERARVEAWLKENERRERQRGLEAAQKLYGQRFAVLGDLPDGVSLDATRWLTQFGVTVVSFGSAQVATRAAAVTDQELEHFGVAGGTPEDDSEMRYYTALGTLCAENAVSFFTVGLGPEGVVEPYALRAFVPEGMPIPVGTSSGDVSGALTAHLLRLVWGQDHVWTSPVERAATEGEEPPGVSTFARIGWRTGRYVCHLFSGRRDFDQNPRFGPAAETLAQALSAGYVHQVAGDHVGAMRAACHALDIDVTVLR
jgi:hypothetical protein